MEDFLVALLQCLLEFLIEIVSYLPFDWPFPSSLESDSLFAKCFWWFVGGSALAAVSLCFLKHTWISFSVLRIANLILAPITAAFFSHAVAWRRSQSQPSIIPRNHFWQSFWFTTGLVIVRFVYAVRK
jgi:hypothetical protein